MWTWRVHPCFGIIGIPKILKLNQVLILGWSNSFSPLRTNRPGHLLQKNVFTPFLLQNILIMIDKEWQDLVDKTFYVGLSEVWVDTWLSFCYSTRNLKKSKWKIAPVQTNFHLSKIPRMESLKIIFSLPWRFPFSN